ncbi:MAG: division/cell wall cluster transcriptional repressor MraZ [Nitrospinota bacterium]|nr:MAG: division/cell wall cluster transcriptional repressor MraZ [Nitrospinota bacterium]
MFLGNYQVKMDAKGRISIPAKYREVLSTEYGPELILTTLDHCIEAYPKQEWLLLTQQLQRLPSLKRDVRMLMRALFSTAHECTLDSQGRILIPAPLREYADLRGDVVILGVNTKIEIWSKERWDAYNSSGREQLVEIADKLAELTMERGQNLASDRFLQT